MKVFLSIKYYEDMRNRELIDDICSVIENENIEVFVFARDIQNYEKCNLSPEEVMKIAFQEIESSDILLIDTSELSIGAGIEVGYAYAHNIPIYLTANKNAEVSNSIKGISNKSIFYENIQEIKNLFI